MAIKRQDVEAFADRFLETPSEERDNLYRELEAMTGVPEEELRKIFVSEETSSRYIIERIQLLEAGDLRRDREDLTALVQRLIDGEGSTAQIDEWLRVIVANVPAPFSYVFELIFEAETTPQAQDVVEKAMAYRPPDAAILL
jgi:hypothetical protein